MEIFKQVMGYVLFLGVVICALSWMFGTMFLVPHLIQIWGRLEDAAGHKIELHSIDDLFKDKKEKGEAFFFLIAALGGAGVGLFLAWLMRFATTPSFLTD
ncbi:MAG: hypothetical protein A2Y61_07690 [Chloroflexi bacterium RBG_13_60_13]|nr:MAG: hypothetical protein A2Y61_07690 [Chloroflexi bacterium RBG_13_60_13]